MANYGSAPYEESAFKAALRNLIAGSAGIGAGLGAVRPGANFADAFLQSAGRSSLAVQQASQAAQDYAIRQEEVRRRREEDAAQAEWRKADIEIRTKQAGKETSPYDKKPWYEDPSVPPDVREMYRKKDTYIAPPKPDKPDKPEGPTAGQRNQVFEAVRLINGMDANDPEDRDLLIQIMKNPPTPEEGEAARKKLMISPGGPGGVGELYRAPTLKKAK